MAEESVIIQAFPRIDEMSRFLCTTLLTYLSVQAPLNFETGLKAQAKTRRTRALPFFFAVARQLLVNLENSQIVIEIVVTWSFGVLSSRSGRL